MTDINIKHLISPFALWLPHTPPIAHKALTRPMCNCDSDEENDFGMAPECAFVCNPFKGKSVTPNYATKKNTSKMRFSTTKRNKKIKN